MDNLMEMVAKDKAEDLCQAMNDNVTIDLVLMFMPLENIDDSFISVHLNPMREFSYFQLLNYGVNNGVFSMTLAYRDFVEVVIELHNKKWVVAE